MSERKVFAFCVHQFCPKRPSRVCLKEGCNNELAGIETIRCSVCKRKICKLHRTNASRIMWSGFFSEIFPLESYFSNGTYYIPSEYESGVFLSEKNVPTEIFFLEEYQFSFRVWFFLSSKIIFYWYEIFSMHTTLMKYDFCD